MEGSVRIYFHIYIIVIDYLITLTPLFFRFQFTLQSDGDLVLQTRAFPLDSANSRYWWSETVDTGFQVVFNESGSIYVAANDGSILKMISSPAGYLKGFYHRAILEYDGVFRHYVYPKSITTANAGNWSPLQSFIPPNICNAIRQRTGCYIPTNSTSLNW